ncbi:MAG: YidC/Oxa1 family membrane protein insertase [Chloroflexi bacterium]|nr:YidC/Oxa1 family membrane protein insertase [Chloroflexota bacterium]MCZ6867387.1 YidC/Oxa1 family membrane protein insertase [Chloroflexota bacterium]
MDPIFANLFTDIWNQGILRPMINSLVFLYAVLFSNMGLSIIAFTIFIRLVTTPLTLRQIRQMRAMSGLQPKLQELREKYKDDKSKLSQETMRMYRQAGVNPLGCLGPMVIQFPIWIGLFQALVQTLPTNPDRLVALSDKLYSWVPFVHEAIPLNSDFLWLNLAEPDPTNLVMPLLVGASTWVQQKMTTSPSADPRQQSTQSMMLWMMPIMLGLLTMTFPSGLALYWVVSNVVGVLTQYFITGWEPLFRKSTAPTAPTPAPAAAVDSQPQEETSENGGTTDTSSDGQDRRRSHRSRHARTRRRSRRGRSRGS